MKEALKSRVGPGRLLLLLELILTEQNKPNFIHSHFLLCRLSFDCIPFELWCYSWETNATKGKDARARAQLKSSRTQKSRFSTVPR